MTLHHCCRSAVAPVRPVEPDPETAVAPDIDPADAVIRIEYIDAEPDPARHRSYRLEADETAARVLVHSAGRCNAEAHRTLDVIDWQHAAELLPTVHASPADADCRRSPQPAGTRFFRLGVWEWGVRTVDITGSSTCRASDSTFRSIGALAERLLALFDREALFQPGHGPVPDAPRVRAVVDEDQPEP